MSPAMLNAKEVNRVMKAASKVFETYYVDKEHTTMYEVMHNILRAAAHIENNVEIYNVSPEVPKELEDLGFGITQHGTYTKVSW